MKKGLLICLLLELFPMLGIAKGKIVRSAHKAEVAALLSQEEQERFLYYFYAAELAFDQGKYCEAFSLYNIAADIQPNDPTTQQMLGQMYDGLSETETSVYHYRRAYELAPDEQWKNYAEALYGQEHEQGEGESGPHKASVEVIEKAISHLPNEVEGREMLLSIYMAQGHYKKALNLLDEVIRLNGLNAFRAVERYKLLIALGKPSEACKAIDHYLELNPDDERVWVTRAHIYLNEGNESEALNILTRTAQRFPSSPYPAIALVDFYKDVNDSLHTSNYAFRFLSDCEVDLDTKLGFIQEYHPYLSTDSARFEKALQQLTYDYPYEGKSYHALAQFYFYKNNYPKAKQVFGTMIEIAPKDPNGWARLFDVLQADSTVTMEEYSAFIHKAAANPHTDDEWSYRLMLLYVIKGQTDSILLEKERILQRVKKTPEALMNVCTIVGDCYHMLGKVDSAYIYYEKALEINPENIYVLNNYAYLLATHQGDLRKAEQMSQITIQKEANNSTYLDTYAWILHLQGQDTLAAFYIKKAYQNCRYEEEGEVREHYTAIIGHEPPSKQ